MKKLIFPLLLLIAAVLLEGCSSGKQAYEKGNYDAAVLKAINRLRKNPNSKKASETLSQSYPLTISWHRDNVVRAKASTDEFKWERVVREYQQVNRLYSELSRCPACLQVVDAVSYQNELNDAKNQAADIRYNKGEQLLVRSRESHNRNEAREAFQHFAVASNLLGEFKDVRDKLAEAKFLATLHVVVEPIPVHSRNLQISNEFFENKILEFVETMPVNEFVRFYSYAEAQNVGLKNPDQIIQLQFDDFVLGQTYLKEKEIHLSKDSVVLAIIKAQNNTSMSDALASNDPFASLKYHNELGPVMASPVLFRVKGIAGNDKKVTICHKIPASLGKTNTITVSENALQHHLDHGDIKGTCEGDKDPQQSTTKEETEESGSQGAGETPNNGTSGQSSGTVDTDQSGSAEEIDSDQQGGGQQKPTTQKVYGTVKATMHVFHKTLTSRGLMDFKIIEVHSQRVLTQEKMPGSFVWYTEWGYFNGDERALDDYFIDISKLKEAQPPASQDLFVAFTQPIYGQITRKIQDFYRNY